MVRGQTLVIPQDDSVSAITMLVLAMAGCQRHGSQYVSAEQDHLQQRYDMAS